ncbi:MAG: hypothetical protein ABIQ93_05095 [Saprospiraceae bacterium]
MTASQVVHFTEGMPADLVPEEYYPAPNFENVCSVFLRDIFVENLPNGVPKKVKVRISNFFFQTSPYLRKYWSENVSFMILWLLSHELGHYLCGHTEYYKIKEGKLGISEKKQKPHYASLYNHNIKDMERRWCCELMADIYATINVFRFGCYELKAGNLRWLNFPAHKNLLTL